jgi:hypothetical protein
MSDIIGQAEQELERITNKREAAVYHRRWLGVSGTLRLMAVKSPGLSHYYRCLHREWRRRATG